MTAVARPIFLTTPEDAAADDLCGMKLWYRRYEQGGGITPKGELLRTEMLEATQSDMRILATLPDISKEAIQSLIDEILYAIPPDQQGDIRAKELLYRRLGWFASYAMFMEPGIRRLYDTLPIEEEIDLDRHPLVIRMKSGRLLRHKHGYRVEHRFFVPTSVSSEKWRSRWEFDIYPQLLLQGAQENYEGKVDFARIVGLNVGVSPSIPDAPLHHPYVYAFFNKLTGEWTNKFKRQDEDGGQWIERGVWESPLSITTWVDKCGAAVADNQFPLSAQVALNRTMMQRWLDRRLYRERNLQTVKIGCKEASGLRNIHFPVHTEQCAPINGAPCDFRHLCWSEQFMRDALLRTKFNVNLPALLTNPVPPKPPTLSQLVEDAMQQAAEEVAEERGVKVIDLSSTHSVAQLAQPQYPAFIPNQAEFLPGVM